MARTIPSIPQYGAKPSIRIESPFGTFKESTNLKTIEGLNSVVKISGSGSVGAVGVTIIDTGGVVRAYMQSNNIHKVKATVYQDIDVNGSITSTKLFTGEVNSPINWNPDTNTIKFEIVSVIESREVSFSVNQEDFDDSEIIGGIKTIEGGDVTEVPPDLAGKPWPVVFGSCLNVPAVGFNVPTIASPTSNWHRSDYTSADSANEEAQAVVADLGWSPIEPAFVNAFVEACKVAARLDKDADLPASVAYWRSVPVERFDSYLVRNVSDVLSSAGAWAKIAQLMKDIGRHHGSLVAEFDALRVAIIEVETTALSDWHTLKDERPDVRDQFIHFEQFVASRRTTIRTITDSLIKPHWPTIVLNSDNKLRRGSIDAPKEYYINGAKVQGRIRNDILEVSDIVSSHSNIPITGAKNPVMFKVQVDGGTTDACSPRAEKSLNLTGFICLVSFTFEGGGTSKQLIKVSKHVRNPKVDKDGGVVRDKRGNIQYEKDSEVYFSPTPLQLTSKDSTVDNTSTRSYSVNYKVVESGTILESAPFVLPSWVEFGWAPTSSTVKKVMNPETLAMHPVLEGPSSNIPKFETEKPILNSSNKMGISGWNISTGDIVTLWGEDLAPPEDCDTENFTGELPEPDEAAKPSTWICNSMHDTDILTVAAYRTVNGLKTLGIVPSSYYIVNKQASIAGQPCTTITLSKALNQHKGEGWSNQLYVTMDSPVGPNTAHICKWLIEKYSDYTVDATSFNSVAASLEKYPSNFAILSQKALLSTLDDIAWQCRCSVYLSDTTVYIKYLPKQEGSIGSINPSHILQGSVSVSLTPTESLVTKISGLWKPSYQDIDFKGDLKPLSRYRLSNNIDLYGVHKMEREIWIYNIESLVAKTVQFWLMRYSNTWNIVSFKTTLQGLKFETQDTFTVDLGSAADIPSTTGIAQSITYDSNSLECDFKVWLPIRAGETTPYPQAFLA